MKKAIISIVLLLALITAAALILRHIRSGTGGLSQAWMNSMLSAWKPTQNSIYPMIFAPDLASVAYGVDYTYGDPKAIGEDYQMLNQTGSQSTAIFPDYGGWILNQSYVIKTYNNVTAEIAANNQTLFIQDAAATYYRYHKENWTEFTKNWVARDRVLASAYHPAYFEVIVEPQWYWPFMVEKGYALNVSKNATELAYVLNTTPLLNITDWINLTNSLIGAVHNVSPNTKIGVSVPAQSLYYPNPLTKHFALKFLQNETKVRGLDFISFDIYGPNDFNSTFMFLDQYGANGKAVWIGQTWASSGIGGSPCSAADSEFLVLVYYFALKIHAQGISPFYTDCFVSYSSRPSNAQQLTDFYQGRTPAFYEFQKIVASNKAGQLLNYTP